MTRKKVRKGLYQHYKGAKYEVLDEALNSENKKELVIYQEVKDGKKDLEGKNDSAKIWARPKELFCAEVEVEGIKKPRFEFIGENTSAENSQNEENSQENSQDLKQKYLRALADYQNLVKRTAQDKIEFVKYANRNLIQEIIPVFDHLKLSLAGLSEDEAKSPWAVGVSHVLNQFREILKDNGVEEIKTIGEKFDHETMEAIEGEGEIVAKEVIPGYKLNGKVIKPAKVITKKE